MPKLTPMRRPSTSISSFRASTLLSATLLGGIGGEAHAGNVCPCLGDLTGNGIVDGADIAIVLGNWGACANCGLCAADITGNCVVDGNDLAIVLGAWGPCAQLPPNDLCSNATVVTGFTGSANPFCTIGATSSGPAISGCSVPGISEISNDVWFRVTAPVTGTLQFGVCADFDVRMAVYGEGLFGACSCPGGLFGAPLIGCSTTESFITCAQGTAFLVEVEAGDCLAVRIGGGAGQVGTGNLDINIYVPPCSAASSTKLAASGLEADTEFGIGLDISGNFAVVGAIFDDILFGGASAGSARVYTFNGTSWSPSATLLSPDVFPFQRFGMNVAVSGDRIVVGAGTIDEACADDPDCDHGIAYVYVFNGATWGFDQALDANVTSAESHFGTRVDIDGDRVIVGARSDDNANGDRAGAAHIFEYTPLFGGVWFESEKLVASDGDNFDEFGSDVAVSGAWAIVGADSDEGGGSAYIFEDTGSDWVQRAKLQPVGLPATADFGYSVAIEGNFAVIGAPDFGQGPGAVYVFERFGALGWLQTGKLEAHDGVDGDSFGSSVSVAASPPGGVVRAQVMVGAASDDDARGAAYVFWRVGGGWVGRGKLTASDGVAGDSFGGGAVAISNGRGLVGAYFDHVAGVADVGSVSAFFGLGECTGNGVMDACDIAGGLPDSDGDGIPDVCEP